MRCSVDEPELIHRVKQDHPELWIKKGDGLYDDPECPELVTLVRVIRKDEIKRRWGGSVTIPPRSRGLRLIG